MWLRVLRQAQQPTQPPVVEALETTFFGNFKFLQMNNSPIHDQIVETLKDIYDPEIPANIYDLGLIYNIDIDKLPEVSIEMTFTSPTCPMAEIIVYQIETRLKLIEGIEQVFVNIVFEPEWNQDCMSDEAKLKLGFL